jgi:hypothetical protein
MRQAGIKNSDSRMRGSIAQSTGNAKVEVVYAKARSQPLIQGRHRQCTIREVMDTWAKISSLCRGCGVALLAAEDGAGATLVACLLV